LDSIKYEICKRIDVGNDKVIDEAAYLAQRFPGDRSVEQVCSIYDYLKNNWNYTGDPRCEEYYRYANQTLRLGERINRAGAGDCDDFAILMSALIENIGGTTRINLAYGGAEGHAYTEVYLGDLDDEDDKVKRTISWLRKEYNVAEINVHSGNIHGDDKEVWLNLDWWADHPGGPFYEAANHVPILTRPDIPKVPLTPPNEPPSAIISYEPEEPNARDTINFNASQSYDPYGKIVEYEWDFEDGNTVRGAAVNYSYSKGGTFTVKLKVTDDEGKTNIDTDLIDVNEPPVAQFKYSIRDMESGYLITFDASKSKDEEDGDIAYYMWNFGDGQKTGEIPDQSVAPHFYPNSGTFNVSLTVKDKKGATGFKLIPIKINSRPIAIFSIDISEPNIGDDIAFDASQSRDDDGKVVEYKWDFGDGETAKGRYVIHDYSTGGAFIAKLEIKDDDNATNSTDREIRVNKPPTASFDYYPANPSVDGIVTFNASQSKDADGRIVDYEWDFGEGGRKLGHMCVDYKYIKSDTYIVILTVTDDKGIKNSSSKKVAVAEKMSSVIEDTEAETPVSARERAKVVAESKQPAIQTWIRAFGGAGKDVGYSVQQTSDGGYIITGWTLGTFGGDDVWLIKTDSYGNKVWDRTFGGAGQDEGYSVQQTSDGGYIITGYTLGTFGGDDVWLIKTDSYGNKVWDRIFGGAGQDEGYSVQQTSDGGYIITGRTLGTLGGDDVWLIKTDSYGNKVWDRIFGGAGQDEGYSVQQTSDGGYIITGYTLGTLGGDDVWLIKTDSYGNKIWDRIFGGAGQDEGYSVQQTSDGGYIITGRTLGTLGGDDVWLIKTDSYGNKVWDRIFGGAGQDWGYSVQQTSDGGYIITGYTTSRGAGGSDIWLIKIDPYGNEAWDSIFGGAGNNCGYSVKQTSDGGYIVAGWTDPYGSGALDVSLIKTDASGNLVE